ncbi:PEP-CTERM sorting domain-containing protein [Hydrogenophaga sp. PBL-H3]|uniref:PEP-CTERM sorting domain-containing protein n=1 Tax=Hydrogenophaga sp. PBL-H3 TaxID=434010 RepID=UPI00131F9025|nr:PEP-CTERM sorting domain-containing protein [Hydrogenophaga sp. PBL-H3]QHE76695.1 PEP-CTERM sorting domain-containing protein [Hydrogenophaga sp. PBL-H3]QHE81119.1 PEP-CTERM sorting domain-containing protein [Hydrogenophaga sp. PBL-H3]
MKNMIVNAVRSAVVTGGLCLAGGANAQLVLPDVEPCGAAIQTALSGGLNNLQCLKGTVTATSPGTYIASYHDEFLSYSIEALETIQKLAPSLLSTTIYGDWSKLVSGSGQLDIGVLIKANGDGVLNNPDPFPDAQSSNTTDPIYVRTWGGSTGTDTSDPGNDPNDPVLTVQEVVDWLSPQLIPVFYFDLADPQAGGAVSQLYFGGQVYLTDSSGVPLTDGNGDPVVWALDNVFDGQYSISGDLALDPDMVLAPQNVPVYIPGSGCSTAPFGADWCLITNSRGSGSPEFIAYAPSMDLSPYAKDGNLFWGNFKIAADGGASEEIYLTKRVSTTDIPEPGILILLGVALAGLGVVRRSKKVV